MLSPADREARDVAIVASFLSPEAPTLAALGKQHGLTRERIRQIVLEAGVSRERLRVAMRADYAETTLRRLLKYKETDGGCWEYQGPALPSGYGRISYKGEAAYAHRVAYELLVGPIPADKPHIMHSCDNPPCINPAHLLAGTPLDNMQDRDRKGRGNKGKKLNKHFTPARQL